MKNWHRIAIVNVASLAGIFVSLFLVPNNTPFWWWAAVGTVLIITINVLLFIRGKRAAPKPDPSRARLQTAAAIVSLLILILEFWFKMRRP
jgi:hypothetical protein